MPFGLHNRRGGNRTPALTRNPFGPDELRLIRDLLHVQ